MILGIGDPPPGYGVGNIGIGGQVIVFVYQKVLLKIFQIAAAVFLRIGSGFLMRMGSGITERNIDHEKSVGLPPGAHPLAAWRRNIHVENKIPVSCFGPDYFAQIAKQPGAQDFKGDGRAVEDIARAPFVDDFPYGFRGAALAVHYLVIDKVAGNAEKILPEH